MLDPLVPSRSVPASPLSHLYALTGKADHRNGRAKADQDQKPNHEEERLLPAKDIVCPICEDALDACCREGAGYGDDCVCWLERNKLDVAWIEEGRPEEDFVDCELGKG